MSPQRAKSPSISLPEPARPARWIGALRRLDPASVVMAVAAAVVLALEKVPTDDGMVLQVEQSPPLAM